VEAIVHFAQYAATSTAGALNAMIDSISQMVVFRISSHIYLRAVVRSMFFTDEYIDSASQVANVIVRRNKAAMKIRQWKVGPHSFQLI